MRIADLKNRRVLVVGLGVTGWSVVRYLKKVDIAFEIADENVVEKVVSEVDPSLVLHRQFDEAVFCSFDIIVLSPGVPRMHPAVVAALQSGVSVIGDIELFAGESKVPVIAVTGSNGKSTVVAWLVETLNACGIHASACGNIGVPALDSLQAEIDVHVLELSSYQLESTESLKPLSATVLNVSEDHLDRYENIDHYATVKRRVYRGAEYCVVNRDDDRSWPDHTVDANCYFFTLSNLTESAGKKSHNLNRSVIDSISIKLPGEHNIANALAVIALAESLDVSRTQLLSALPLFAGLAHRNEFVAEKAGVRWYNDSKGTNVEACKCAVMAMPGPVVLIAGGIGKGADFSSLTNVVRQYVKLLVLIGQDRQLMADHLSDCVETVLSDSLHNAVKIAGERVASGDVVLLSPACSSFDMFKNFQDRGEQFKAAVCEVLAA